jgi:hypothetical protein
MATPWNGATDAGFVGWQRWTTPSTGRAKKRGGAALTEAVQMDEPASAIAAADETAPELAKRSIV